MHDNNRYGTSRIVLRTMVPSFTGMILYVIFGVLLALGHIMLLSLRQGAEASGLVDEHVAESYGLFIAQPVSHVLNSVRFDSVMVAVLWGLAGLLTYSIIEQLIRARRDWQEAQHDVQFINAQTIVQHPMKGQYWSAVLWRTAISVLILVYVVAIQPALRWIYTSDVTIMHGMNGMSLALNGAAVIGVWILVLHVAVVLIRLYMKRTRLWG